MENLWYYGKTIVIWKKYGTMEITMVLYRKLLIFDLPRKNHGRLPKTKKLFGEKNDKIPKQLKILHKFIALEL